MALQRSILPHRGRTAALALLSLAAFAPLSANADVLVDNVDGLTLDAEGKVERFTGLLVGDDGRIEQVLRRGEKRPGKVDYLVNGKGRVVIPGLIDSHVRLMDLGFSLFTRAPVDPLKDGPAKEGARSGQPRPEDRDQALAEAQQALLSRGITAVADMGTTIEDWQAYRRAGDLGSLRIRIVAYAASTDAMVLIGGPGPTPWLYNDRLRLNGVRLVLDGPLASRAAALKAPYADAPANRTAPRLSDTQLKNLMSRAAMDNFQVAIEANGDKSVATALDAIGELAETYKGERRWRLEGVEVIDPADLPRLRQSGVIASLLPQQFAADYAGLEARLGPMRLTGAHAWKSLADAGAGLAFGSDAPAKPADAFAGIATAISRQDASGQPFGGWQAQERLTREAALAALTVGGARAAFAEGRFGRLTKGQRADFLLLDGDPLLAASTDLRAIRVLQTWVGGVLAWQAKDAATEKAAGPEGR